MGGRWHGDYIVTPLADFQPTNKSGTLRIFRVKEVVVDSTVPVQFPRQAVKDRLDRTFGPHGDTTKVKLWGVDEEVEINNKEPSQYVLLKEDDGADVDAGKAEIAEQDFGASVRKRYANTTRPVGVPTDVWKRMTQADKQ